MAFHEVRFPDDISRGARGGPERRTQVVELASGDEERNASWADSRALRRRLRHPPRRRPRRGYRLLRGAQWSAARLPLEGLGRLRSGLPSTPVTPIDQALGTGDGATTAFQLAKRYESGAQSWVRRIVKPVAGTVRIARAGAEAVSGWSVDATTGIVTFTDRPRSRRFVTAGFEFDVPVRFDTDRLDVTWDLDRLGSIASIPLLEVRR